VHLGWHDGRRPRRDGIFGGFLNDTAERLGRSGQLIARDGCRGTRRTRCAGDLLGIDRRGYQPKELAGNGESEEISILWEFVRGFHMVGDLILYLIWGDRRTETSGQSKVVADFRINLQVGPLAAIVISTPAIAFKRNAQQGASLPLLWNQDQRAKRPSQTNSFFCA
jgi:hypothetical protein